MNSVSVVALGPGAKDYILPACIKAVEKADIVVGAKRHLDALDIGCKQTFAVEGKFAQMLDFIKDNAAKHKIAVVVSGDTGFYSLLRFIKNSLADIEFDVCPGLSAMTLMFARLGFMHDDAYTGSVHGRRLDAASLAGKYSKVGLLTDNKTTPALIAKMLIDAGITGKTIAIGERLSYPNERIRRLTIKEAAACSADPLSVLVIYDEDVCV